MDEKTKKQDKNELTEKQAFDELEAISGFQIEPYDGVLDLEDRPVSLN